jgi:hypothetical protein
MASQRPRRAEGRRVGGNLGALSGIATVARHQPHPASEHQRHEALGRRGGPAFTLLPSVETAEANPTDARHVPGVSWLNQPPPHRSP